MVLFFATGETLELAEVGKRGVVVSVRQEESTSDEGMLKSVREILRSIKENNKKSENAESFGEIYAQSSRDLTPFSNHIIQSLTRYMERDPSKRESIQRSIQDIREGQTENSLSMAKLWDVCLGFMRSVYPLAPGEEGAPGVQEIPSFSKIVSGFSDFGEEDVASQRVQIVRDAVEEEIPTLILYPFFTEEGFSPSELTKAYLDNVFVVRIPLYGDSESNSPVSSVIKDLETAFMLSHQVNITRRILKSARGNPSEIEIDVAIRRHKALMESLSGIWEHLKDTKKREQVLFLLRGVQFLPDSALENTNLASVLYALREVIEIRAGVRKTLYRQANDFLQKLVRYGNVTALMESPSEEGTFPQSIFPSVPDENFWDLAKEAIDEKGPSGRKLKDVFRERQRDTQKMVEASRWEYHVD